MITNKQREQLVYRRQELGYSQQAIADRIGVSRVYVTHWESGRRVPSTDNLKKWCKALNLKCRVVVEIG
jgi:transcriptional regulator with XRE-family HTH domain